MDPGSRSLRSLVRDDIGELPIQFSISHLTEKQTSAFSRRDTPELCFVAPPENARAQGRPGARCTRGLVRKLK
jgi:hypothetical protein